MLPIEVALPRLIDDCDFVLRGTSLDEIVDFDRLTVDDESSKFLMTPAYYKKVLFSYRSNSIQIQF